MLQCKDCEYCVQDQMGRIQLRCNPFVNIKEPECMQKWMVLKMDIMIRAHQSTLNFYQKFAPLQEKMFKHIEREIEDIEDSDKWKYEEEKIENEDDFDEDDILGENDDADDFDKPF
jgi:hypothetical protein